MRRRPIAGTTIAGWLLAAALCAPQTVRAAPLEIELARLITNHPNILAAENTLESSRP